jgi:hypothetical protein
MTWQRIYFTLVKTNAKKNINSMINDLAMGVKLIYDKAGLMPSNQSTGKTKGNSRLESVL